MEELFGHSEWVEPKALRDSTVAMMVMTIDPYFKGLVEGKIYRKTPIEWENLWFPVDFPLNQSIEY